MFVLPLASVSRRAASQRTFDRLLDDSLDTLTPALDVTESDTAYTLQLDVPGVTREQLEVTIEGRRVSVATAKPATDAVESKSQRVLYRERTAPRYARTVSLPAEVDSATSQARVDNGVLTLTLAKKVVTGPRKISVN